VNPPLLLLFLAITWGISLIAFSFPCCIRAPTARLKARENKHSVANETRPCETVLSRHARQILFSVPIKTLELDNCWLPSPNQYNDQLKPDTRNKVLTRKIVCCDLPTPRKIIRDKRSSHPHPDVSMCGVRTPGYIHDTGHHSGRVDAVLWSDRRSLTMAVNSESSSTVTSPTETQLAVESWTFYSIGVVLILLRL
jgi:hypothetical protein